MFDRDALYRECAWQTGLVREATDELTGEVDRIHGGAWVTCEVWVSNAEVSELLSQERRERRIEMERRKVEHLAMLHEVDELAERITS